MIKVVFVFVKRLIPLYTRPNIELKTKSAKDW
jgi:hypothetical protein